MEGTTELPVLAYPTFSVLRVTEKTGQSRKTTNILQTADRPWKRVWEQ